MILDITRLGLHMAVLYSISRQKGFKKLKFDMMRIKINNATVCKYNTVVTISVHVILIDKKFAWIVLLNCF